MSKNPRKAWLELVSSINTWKKGTERAVNKPLLTLLLLARALRGDSSSVPFEELNEPLARLLKEFGPRRQSYHPEYPFWYLQSDGFWKVKNADSFSPREGGHSPSKSVLLNGKACGYVPDELWHEIKRNEQLVWELQRSIMDEFWPGSLHAAIAQAIGLLECHPVGEKKNTQRRDPKFRSEVLRAYERRCAVCGYDGRLSDMPLGLEAAHVRWHAYDGPDTVDNGLALCAYHHVALDSGALGVSESNSIVVSCDVTGGSVVEDLLLRFSGKTLRTPQSNYPRISAQYFAWHTREVFKSPARYPVTAIEERRLYAAEETGKYE